MMEALEGLIPIANKWLWRPESNRRPPGPEVRFSSSSDHAEVLAIQGLKGLPSSVFYMAEI